MHGPNLKGRVYIKEPFWVHQRMPEIVWPGYPIPYKHGRSLKVFQDENRHFTASTPQVPNKVLCIFLYSLLHMFQTWRPNVKS